MKNEIIHTMSLLLLGAGILLWTGTIAPAKFHTYAQSPTTTENDDNEVPPTESPIPTPTVKEEVKQILEKSAEQVEQDKVNQKPTAGTIESIEGDIITIITPDDIVLKAKVDDLITEYYQIVGNQKKSIEQDDIEEGDYIIVLGNLIGDTIQASQIVRDVRYVVRSGRVMRIDTTQSSITLITPEKDEFTIDVLGNKTERLMLDMKTMEHETISFSKIKEGDSIHFVAERTAVEKSGSRFQALSMFIIPQEFFAKKSAE